MVSLASREHPEPRVLFVRLPDAAMTRRAASPIRASAQPRNQRHAVRPCASANLSTSACISSANSPTRSALPSRTSNRASNQSAASRAIGCPTSRARACASLQARATALHQAQVQQVHREQPQQRGLRIGQEAPFRWCIQRRDGGETSLSPCAPGTRPALQQVHVCLHGARAQQRNRVVRCRCQRVGSFRQRKRLVVLGAQAENEPEPVQEASPHRVLRHVAEQGMRPLQSAFRLGGGEATQMGEPIRPEALQA